MEFNMTEDQLWIIVIGTFLGISEALGIIKRGPNGILHAIWKFYNIKVEMEYDDEMDIERYNQTLIPDREQIVMESSKANNDVISPNVVLIGSNIQTRK
jgi:hypothetical protein